MPIANFILIKPGFDFDLMRKLTWTPLPLRRTKRLVLVRH